MRKLIWGALLSGALWGCTGKSNEAAPAPEKAVLTSPAKDEACTSGILLSDVQSTVTFRWTAAANAESYELTLKNLLTGVSTTAPTTATQLAVNILRGTPFSWFITSKSTKSTATAKSDTWKFYNAGVGATSYAPFPAEIVSPASGQGVSATGGRITLSWKGADVDNDIATYDVYFGTTPTPTILGSGVIASSFPDVPVSSGITYYWRVVTKDKKGNSSDSGVVNFKVN